MNKTLVCCVLGMLGWVMMGCAQNDRPQTDAGPLPPDSLAMPTSPVVQQALYQMPHPVLARLAQVNQPDAQGALGRNKAGYFHVRFQMGISALADYGCARPDGPSLLQAAQALRYSFAHQLPAGNFELHIPKMMAHKGKPSVGDEASGVAFFLSAVAATANAVQSSPMGQQHALVHSLDSLRPAVQMSLTWLLAHEGVLLAADKRAPNRLLFDAIAFYGLGRWTGHLAAQETGLRFMRMALQAQHPSGYFIEGGGYDSSYNGVCLANALRLLLLLSADAPPLPELWRAITRAARWQASRVLASGQVSTAGNTRVYAGGEKFMGDEKHVAVSTIWQAFHLLHTLTKEPSYAAVATRMEQYYDPAK